MLYKVEIEDHIRVPPALMTKELDQAVLTQLREKFEGYISREFGNVIDVCKVLSIGEGVIVPGDGAPYYKTKFVLLSFKPELQEVVHGRIKDMADFGAFINMGPMDGMIHISQTMDDFVSFSKEKVLTGRDSHRTLKVGDECRARIIAVSFKDISNPKIGVTMRQQGLGKFEWISEDFKTGPAKEPKKEAKKEAKKK
jgi:DNA-directed RNA polymerase subunit E'